jgi:3-oxoacyl-[acyl-carrier-protein] synthase-3
MGAFLPGPPVANHEVEDILGRIHGRPSRLGPRVLRSNGILTRHYALDAGQRTTHQNSDLAVEAARRCLSRASLDQDAVDMLAVGSTQGDLPLPGLASMVQAGLRLPPCEIVTTHGVCSAGIQALRSASAQVRLGERRHALVCATELASRLLKRSRYEAAGAGASDAGLDADSEFLRWMLSDGAGAMLVQDRPAPRGLSLRIDWIEILSFAGDYPLCMSCGTAPEGGGARNGRAGSGDAGNGARSWQDYPTYAEAERAGALLIRQDLKTLDNVVKVGLEGYLRLLRAGRISAADIDHFVCHYSSHYFRGRTLELMRLMGCVIPEEKWFTNLYSKGNTGCAAIFIALEELLYSDRLRPGQTVFCFVPESGRFVAAYIRMTVVDGGRA